MLHRGLLGGRSLLRFLETIPTRTSLKLNILDTDHHSIPFADKVKTCARISNPSSLLLSPPPYIGLWLGTDEDNPRTISREASGLSPFLLVSGDRPRTCLLGKHPAEAEGRGVDSLAISHHVPQSHSFSVPSISTLHPCHLPRKRK